MSRAGDHGRLLLEQGRAELAEEQLRRALGEEPDDVEALVALALCHAQLDRTKEALEEARRAIGLSPDWSLPQLVAGQALLALGQAAQAEAAAREAIRLDPDDASHYALLASTMVVRRRWEEALAAADDGLQQDPEDEDCANVRALALIQLGRAGDADFALGAALRRNPEDPITHQNLGWAALHRGEARGAIEHYREALRLDPSSDAARAGLVEALKARHFVYRLVLRFFLRMTRVRPATAMAIMVGTVLARGALSRLAESQPALAPVLWPLYWALVAFVLLTWLAPPLFNLVLRFDRDGRHALSPDQLAQSHGLLGMLLLAGAATVLWRAGVPGAGATAVCLAALVLPVTATLGRPRGARLLLGAWTLALALAGAGYVVSSTTRDAWRERMAPYFERLSDEARHDGLRAELEVSRWPAADRDAFLELGRQAPDMVTTAERSSLLLNIFLWGWVAFTWFCSVRSARA